MLVASGFDSAIEGAVVYQSFEPFGAAGSADSVV